MEAKIFMNKIPSGPLPNRKGVFATEVMAFSTIASRTPSTIYCDQPKGVTPQCREIAREGPRVDLMNWFGLDLLA